MHPRNIFKDCRPNFEELAEEFPEFQPFVYKGAAGKPYVDFQDPASLKALSTVLLKKHFDIVMEVPLDRLIPTVPLRLNYLHWIEDLLIDVDGGGGGDGKAKGLDVGTVVKNTLLHTAFSAILPTGNNSNSR